MASTLTQGTWGSCIPGQDRTERTFFPLILLDRAKEVFPGQDSTCSLLQLQPCNQQPTARFKGSSCTHSSILSLLRLHQYNTCTSTTSPMYCVRRCVVFYRCWFLHSNPNSSSASSPPPCACHPDAYPSKTKSVPQSETHGVHSHGPVSAGQFNRSSSLL